MTENQCTTLTADEKKKTLSAKKGKKMIYKSILMPTMPTPLNRLQESTDYLESVFTRELSAVKNVKCWRHDLAIGTNSLNKEMDCNNVSAIVVASDIEPPSLIAHIIIKAAVNKTPIIKMNKLRNITKTCLGFECISIGFKKDGKAFNNSITTINRIYLDSSYVKEMKDSRTPTMEPPPLPKFAFKKREFQYLMRVDGKRAFIPDNEEKETKNNDSVICLSVSNTKFKPAVVSIAKPKRKKNT